MTLSPEDLNRLEEVATAATGGEWKACGSIYEHMNCEVRSGAKGEGQAIAQVWDGPNAFKDGQHIAAANPQTVLALIDHIRKMGAEAEEDKWAMQAVVDASPGNAPIYRLIDRLAARALTQDQSHG